MKLHEVAQKQDKLHYVWRRASAHFSSKLLTAQSLSNYAHIVQSCGEHMRVNELARDAIAIGHPVPAREHAPHAYLEGTPGAPAVVCVHCGSCTQSPAAAKKSIDANSPTGDGPLTAAKKRRDGTRDPSHASNLQGRGAVASSHTGLRIDIMKSWDFDEVAALRQPDAKNAQQAQEAGAKFGLHDKDHAGAPAG